MIINIGTTSSELYIWARDILITLIGVFAALILGWYVDRGYKRKKIKKLYKYLKQEVNENIELMERFIEICNKNLEFVKNKSYIDKSAIFAILDTLAEKIKCDMYLAIKGQDLMYIIKEKEFSIISQTYGRFKDIKDVINTMQNLSNYDEAEKDGISKAVIEVAKKEAFITTFNSVRYIANEAKNFGLKLCEILK